jgi:hypothetical protein
VWIDISSRCAEPFHVKELANARRFESTRAATEVLLVELAVGQGRRDLDDALAGGFAPVMSMSSQARRSLSADTTLTAHCRQTRAAGRPYSPDQVRIGRCPCARSRSPGRCLRSFADGDVWP